MDTLSKMETEEAQELLTKWEENMAGISEERRKTAVWSLMLMAEKKRGGTAGERRMREGGRKREKVRRRE